MVGRVVVVAVGGRILDRGLPVFIIGYRWGVVMEKQFLSEDATHAFERAVHARLHPRRVNGRIEVHGIGPGDLEAEWESVFPIGKWGTLGARSGGAPGTITHFG